MTLLIGIDLGTNFEITQSLAGRVDEAIVFGGGARSALWREIIGDVINLPLLWTPTMETVALGAAMLAGLGSGVFPSLTEEREPMVQVAARRDPNPSDAARYAAMYERYRRVEASHLKRVD